MSPLDPAFQYQCSRLSWVGCSGLFQPWDSGQTEVAVLRNGLDNLAVRLRLIQTAQRSIRIQSLIFRADESGLAIAEILRAKARAGLQVRVIVDWVTNLDPRTQAMYAELM
ncbi:MAG: phospholipase D-like domain-containing protein, partial [Phycisphaerae bacterium]